ncbi:MAG: alpha/beta hydrolase fold domain-containing protein, partial [Steroidobacteraceae bacterium]
MRQRALRRLPWIVRSPAAELSSVLRPSTVSQCLTQPSGAIGKRAIGGDSAGANLAVAACLMLRDAGEAHRLRGMLLSYG